MVSPGADLSFWAHVGDQRTAACWGYGAKAPFPDWLLDKPALSH